MGVDPVYADGARALAAELVRRDLGLVYGGGNVGLMGVIADEVMRLGGRAIGVIPQALVDKEVAHFQITQLHVVKNMHERKAMMAQLSDGFIAMPGGIGTLEELFEIFTWAQLGLHNKPLGLLNVQGFYNGLIGFLDHVVAQSFLKPAQASMLLHAIEPGELVDNMQAFVSPARQKLLDQETARRIV